jgi:hypothetical protein
MRANWGESTKLEKSGTELGEHNTVYLVLTEALHGLRLHRCKSSSSLITIKADAYVRTVEQQRKYYNVIRIIDNSGNVCNTWLYTMFNRLSRRSIDYFEVPLSMQKYNY